MPTVDQAIDEAVYQCLDENYSAQCIADWCREDLQLQLDASEFSGNEAEQIQGHVAGELQQAALVAVQIERNTIGKG